MSRPWTRSQRTAIESRGRDLLVSAGAGAGKTATLVERIAARIAEPGSTVSIEDFLVVTFTRAASEEMRTRIAARLAELASDNVHAPAERLRIERERQLVQRARISTIHAWCLDLVTANAVRLGLPPVFEIADEAEDALLRHDLAVARLESALADPILNRVAKRMLDSLDALAEPKGLAKQVLRALAFLEALPDPVGFVASTCHVWNEAATSGVNWSATDLGSRIRAIRQVHVRVARKLVADLIAMAPRGPETPSRKRVVGVLRDLATALRADEAAAPALDKTDISFTAGRGAEDPLRDLLKEVRDDLLNALGAMRAIDGITTESYFVPRAETLAFFLRDMALGVMLDHREAAIRERRLSYGHLERFALELLAPGSEASPGSAIEVLVDEFQDVNPLQDALFEAIMERVAPRPLRFSVGDAKQSIYGFRQAAPELFGAMIEAADPTLAAGRVGRIALRENFRSVPRLITEFNAIFADLFSRAIGGIDYGELNALLPGVPVAEGDHATPVSLTTLFREAPPDGEDVEETAGECDVAAHAIAALNRPWKDVVVLLRRRGSAITQMATALDRAGVPWVADGTSGLLDSPEIHEVLALLRAIHNPHDEIALLGALRGPAGNVEARALLDLARREGDSFIERIEAAEGEMATFAKRLRGWQVDSMSKPLAAFVAQLYDELDIEACASVRPAGDRRLRHLAAFHEMAEAFDGFSRTGLAAFLKYVDESAGVGQTVSEVPAGIEAVRILTMHQSKGCEFPIVVIPLLGTKFNEDDLRAQVLLDRNQGAGVASLETGEDTIDPLLDEMKRIRRRAMLGEEMRLLYVALTRARERVLAFGTSRRSFAKWQNGEVIPLGNGPLSDPDRERAHCMLDWMLMHAMRRFADAVGSGQLPIFGSNAGFEVALIGPGRAGTVTAAPSHDSSPTGERDLAALAQRILNNIATLTIPPKPRIRAKLSVSEVKRAHDPPPEMPIPRREETAPFQWRHLTDNSVPTAAAVGNATHRFLASCSFEEIARGRSLAGEAARLVAAGSLNAADASRVLLDEMASFFSGGIGADLLANGASARREVPFTVAVRPEDLLRGGEVVSPGPVILQGIIDLYFRMPDGGVVLIDFKTDRCGPDGGRVLTLAQSYAPQIILYRAALERVLGERLAGAHLVFLRAGRIVEVPRRGLAEDELARLLQPAAVVGESPEPRAMKEPR